MQKQFLSNRRARRARRARRTFSLIVDTTFDAIVLFRTRFYRTPLEKERATLLKIPRQKTAIKLQRQGNIDPGQFAFSQTFAGRFTSRRTRDRTLRAGSINSSIK